MRPLRTWTHGIAFVAVLMLGSSACVDSRSTECGDTVCAPGLECDEVHWICVNSDQLYSCQGRPDGAACELHGDDRFLCDQQVCIPSSCGDGLIDANQGEECDDAQDNSDTAADACRNNCTVAHCGDGTIDTDEECDDGPDNSDTIPGACRNSCLWALCGNGIRESGEDCDLDDLSSQTCSGLGFDGGQLACGAGCAFDVTSCQAICGNSAIAPTEGCDDGNTATGDGCTDFCAVETGWQCQGTPSVCTPICGDGLILGTEECDDGNATAGDGCSATCQVEPGWSCNGEPSQCDEICGDGLVKGLETCDDDEQVDGDGCGADCQQEPGWACSGEPSQCSEVCGDGLIVGAEVCDGANLDGVQVCSDVYAGTLGLAACDAGCDAYASAPCCSDTDWHVETAFPLGPYAFSDYSLAVDSANRPHIAYPVLTNPSIRRVVYASWDGSTWQFETVDDLPTLFSTTSLALDSQGRPHISYATTTDLYYAHWDGSAWQIQTVVTGTLVSLASIALDSADRPHIVYQDQAGLEYVYWDGAAWQPAMAIVGGSSFVHVSMAMDPGDTPHLVYTTDTDTEYYHLVGSTWQPGKTWPYGYYGALAIDGVGHPHVCVLSDVTNNPPDSLSCEYWDGSAWQGGVLDTNQVGYDGLTMALDGAGRTHVSYWDAATSEWKYAYHDGSAWQFRVVDGNYATTIKLKLDGLGHPHLAAKSYTGMMYARLTCP